MADGLIIRTRDIIPTAITAGMPIRYTTQTIRIRMRMSISPLHTARAKDCSAMSRR